MGSVCFQLGKSLAEVLSTRPRLGWEEAALMFFSKEVGQTHEIIVVLKYCSEASMRLDKFEPCIQYKLMKFSGVMITLLQYIDLKQASPRGS